MVTTSVHNCLKFRCGAIAEAKASVSLSGIEQFLTAGDRPPRSPCRRPGVREECGK